MIRQRSPKIRILSAFVFFSAVLTVLIAPAAPAQQADTGQPSAQSSAVSVPVQASTPAQLLLRLPLRAGGARVSVDGSPEQRNTSIALDSGDSLFLPVVTYPSGGWFAFSVAVADMDGDGRQDLAVANCNPENSLTCAGAGEVGVLLGNGDGTFLPVVTYGSGGAGAYSIAAADVNGDGEQDLLVANTCGATGSDCWGNGSVGVLLGNGDGTFRAAVTYDSGGIGPSSIAVASVNGDANPDLIVANLCASDISCTGSISVLLGNGDGSFRPAATYSSGGMYSLSVAVSDVNDDGWPDLLVANECNVFNCASGSVGVLLGKWNGTFQAVVIYTSGGMFAFSTAAGDVNGDGRPDVAVANVCVLSDICSGSAHGLVGVLLGNGDGTFHPVVTYDSGGLYAMSVAISDINGDGKSDLLVGNHNSGNIGVLLGNGDGTFQPSVTYAGGRGGPNSITVADLNGDGQPDVVAGNDKVAAGSTGTVGVLLKSGSTQTPTTTSLASSVNPSVYGHAVTFTAQVTASSGTPTGTVNLLDGITAVGSGTLTNGSVSIVVSLLAVGSHSMTAAYQGSAGFAPSTSAPLTQLVTIATTTTTLVSSLNPSLVGQAVTFTATVSSSAGAPPNGEIITFYNGSAVLGTAPLSAGMASLTTSSLAAGIYTITAIYPGDANFAASTSPGLRQVVNSTTKSATATTLVSSLNPSIYGQSVTWTATVTTSGPVVPTGKVKFTWSIYTIGVITLNGSGVATLTKSNLNADPYPLTAVYLGDANNLGSTSSVLNQVVTQATSSASLTSSPNPSTLGQAVTFTATITSPTVTPTGPVTFAVGKTVLGTAQLSGGKAKFTTSTLAVGATKVTATYYGNSNIAKSSASVTQTVQQ